MPLQSHIGPSPRFALSAFLVWVLSAQGCNTDEGDGAEAGEQADSEEQEGVGLSEVCLERNPDYACSPIDCGSAIECGPFDSAYDEIGCFRPHCLQDSDCPTGEGCYDPANCHPSWLTCEMNDGAPSLSFTGDCGGMYCLPEELLGTDANWNDSGNTISVCAPGVARDPIQFGGPEIEDWGEEGIVMTTTVTYNGSCVPHRIALCWDGTFEGEGSGAEAKLFLAHDANEDACEDDVEEGRNFQLRPVIEAYREQFDTESGEIRFVMEGVEAPVVFDF